MVGVVGVSTLTSAVVMELYFIADGLGLSGGEGEAARTSQESRENLGGAKFFSSERRLSLGRIAGVETIAGIV